jgi:hypothetical protein
MNGGSFEGGHGLEGAVVPWMYPRYICRFNYVQFKIVLILSPVSVRSVVNLWYLADL